MAKLQLYIISILTCYTTIQGQLEDLADACCAANLFDSGGGNIALDVRSHLEQDGIFDGVEIVACTTTETYIQLWQEDEVEPLFYHLKWQSPVTATQLGTVYIPFDEPMPIDSSYRLGVWSPSSFTDKHNLPYKFDDREVKYFETLLSKDAFKSGDLDLPLDSPVEFDALKFVRTFVPYVAYCTQGPICPESKQRQFSTQLVQGPKGPKGAQGIPGPPGPPGQGCDSLGGAFNNPFQDAIGGVNQQVADVKQDTDNIFQIIQEMANKISELTTANLVTGTCPPGFISGSYGVGACYFIYRESRRSFGGAQLYCRTRFFGTDASLVDIRTALEDTFMRNYITQMISQTGDGGVETFWTSGMYSSVGSQWVWYDELITLQNTLLYENFRTDSDRDTDRQTKRCLTFYVDAETNTSGWRSDFCEIGHYFICKVVKKCL